MNHILSLEQQDMPSGALYVVGSPIGNLGDITYRAVHVLKSMDGVACEDTRHSSNLLNTLGINKPLLALHEHNEYEASNLIAIKLQSGERWAYLCDAGTPGVSDPGLRLVKELQEKGLLVIPIPGPSAVTTLFSVAGKAALSSEGAFQFLGFLPLKGKDRSDSLLLMDQSKLSTIFYESPQRLLSTLNDLHRLILDKNRALVIGRELTKKFETISYIKLHQIPGWIEANSSIKGELCLILEGSTSVRSSTLNEVSLNPQKLALVLSEHLGSKQISEVLSKSNLMTKKEAYDLALLIKNPPIGG
jgi:16S rRNA (cytidine1402-2'-O)-methyltransferase